MKKSFFVKLAFLLLTSSMLPGCIWWGDDEGRRGDFHERDRGDHHEDHRGDHHEEHHEDYGDHR